MTHDEFIDEIKRQTRIVYPAVNEEFLAQIAESTWRKRPAYWQALTVAEFEEQSRQAKAMIDELAARFKKPGTVPQQKPN